MAEEPTGADQTAPRTTSKTPARAKTARQSRFVDQLVTDPSNVPALGTLVGFVGRGSDEGKTRIYSDASLSSYVEVDADKVRHVEELEDSPLGASMIWIDATATVTPGAPSEAQLAAAKAQLDFLSGGITKGHLGDSVEDKRIVGRIPLSWVAATCANGYCIESFRFCGGFGGIIRTIIESIKCPDPVPDFHEQIDNRVRMMAMHAQAPANVSAGPVTHCGGVQTCGGVQGGAQAGYTAGGNTLCGGIHTCGGCETIATVCTQPAVCAVSAGPVTHCGGVQTCGGLQGGMQGGAQGGQHFITGPYTLCGGVHTCGGMVSAGPVTHCGGVQTCGGAQAGGGAEAAAFLQGGIMQQHLGGAAAYQPGTTATVCTRFGPNCGATVTRGGNTLCGGIQTCGGQICVTITQGPVTMCGGVRTCGGGGGGTITAGGFTMCGGIQGCTVSFVANTCHAGLCQAGTVGAECHFDVTTPQWKVNPAVHAQADFLGGPIAQGHLQGAAPAQAMMGHSHMLGCHTHGQLTPTTTVQSLMRCPSKGIPCGPRVTVDTCGFACVTLPFAGCGPGPVSMRDGCPTMYPGCGVEIGAQGAAGGGFGGAFQSMPVQACPPPGGAMAGVQGYPTNPTVATHCFICPPMTYRAEQC